MGLICRKSYASYQQGCRCTACRAATKQYMDDWHAKNPDKRKTYDAGRRPREMRTPEAARKSRLKTRYGVTDFDAMFDAQGRKCACCGTATARGLTKQWQVDHCHFRRTLRGILCARCNRIIGQLGDRASSVAVYCTRMLAYLATYNDALSPREFKTFVTALAAGKSCELRSATGAADPDRPAKLRHEPGRGRSIKKGKP